MVAGAGLLTLAGIAGCTGSDSSSLRYPDRFLALSEPYESQATMAGGEGAVSRSEEELFEGVPASALGFVKLMRTIVDDPDWREKARAVYASELYFSDTLGSATTIDELLDHLQGVADNSEALEVLVQDVVTSETGTYLRWHMVSRFSILGSEKESRTIGVSLLRFDAEGRIVFQQDYWDSTEGFYQHIPILGSVLRAIGQRFE
ncbi:MAG: nuclear transport factor 2 family protein [Pseudomonadaceae bacterium]|nr:nuclear transport factor 2 family protein [Pseudomonadaceae bacterium]